MTGRRYAARLSFTTMRHSVFFRALFVFHQLPNDAVTGERGEGHEAAAESGVERILVLSFGAVSVSDRSSLTLHAHAHRLRERNHFVEKKLQGWHLKGFIARDAG